MYNARAAICSLLLSSLALLDAKYGQRKHYRHVLTLHLQAEMTTTVCVFGCETNKKHVPKILIHFIFLIIFTTKLIIQLDHSTYFAGIHWHASFSHTLRNRMVYVLEIKTERYDRIDESLIFIRITNILLYLKNLFR